MSRCFGKRSLTTRAADPHLAAGDLLEPRDHPQNACLAAAGRADEDHEFAVVDLEVELLDCPRTVRVDLLERLESDLSHRHLQHHFAARSARRGEHVERGFVVVEREQVRDQTARPQPARVEQLDDAGPRGGGVTEAAREREVVVDQQVARELQCRRRRRQPERERLAAASNRAHGCRESVHGAGRLDRDVEGDVAAPP